MFDQRPSRAYIGQFTPAGDVFIGKRPSLPVSCGMLWQAACRGLLGLCWLSWSGAGSLQQQPHGTCVLPETLVSACPCSPLPILRSRLPERAPHPHVRRAARKGWGRAAQCTRVRCMPCAARGASCSGCARPCRLQQARVWLAGAGRVARLLQQMPHLRVPALGPHRLSHLPGLLPGSFIVCPGLQAGQRCGGPWPAVDRHRCARLALNAWKGAGEVGLELAW